MAFDRILIPLDGSQLAEESVAHAVHIGRAYGSRIFLLQILDVREGASARCAQDVDWRLYRVQVLDYLNALAARIGEQGVEVETHVIEGRAPDQIVEFVRDRRVDLVVMCAYGSGGISEFPFGGTVQKVIAAPDSSVLIVRPTHSAVPADVHYGRILLPLDGSQRAAWAVSLVAGMVNHENPEIIALQVVAPPDMPRTCPLTREELELRNKLVDCNRRAASSYLDEIKQRFIDTLSIRTRIEVSPCVAETIGQVAEAEGADLVAMTAHGASCAIGRSSGTICQAIIMTAARPVLVFQDNAASYRDRSDPPTAQWSEHRLGIG